MWFDPDGVSYDQLVEKFWPGRLVKPIVTEITPAATFHAAEDYHQQYFSRRSGGACAVTIP